MRLRSPSGRIAACAALISTLVLPIGTLALDPARPVSSAVHNRSAAQRASIAYWTPKRMRTARKVAQVMPGPLSPRLGIADRPSGTPGHVEASQGGGRPAIASVSLADAYAYPFPFTRYAVES